MNQTWKINRPCEITFKPVRRQYDALQYLLNDETNEILYGGAGGGGKTYLGCVWIVMMCIKYPGTRWLFGRSTLNLIKGSTMNTFYDVCRENHIYGDGVHFIYNQQSNIIRWFNGSEIVLRHLEYKPSDPKFDSLGGLEIAGAFIDEVAQVTDQAVQIVKSRLGWVHNKGLESQQEITPKLLMGCNPNKGFTYKEFYIKHRDGTLEHNKAYVPALSVDNKHLSKGRLKQLTELKGIDRRRLLLGEWEYDGDPSALIDYDCLINITNNSHINNEIDNRLVSTKRMDSTVDSEKYITCDPARMGKDNTVIWVWHGLNAYKKVIIEKCKLDEIVNVIKDLEQKENVPRTNVIIDTDGVGGGVSDYLRGCVNFHNASSPLHKEQYDNLKTQCYYKLADMINDNNIYISAELNGEEDTHIREELEQVRAKDFDKDGKKKIVSKDEIKKAINRSPDYSDSLMLRMYPIVKHNHQDWDDTYSISIF